MILSINKNETKTNGLHRNQRLSKCQMLNMRHIQNIGLQSVLEYYEVLMLSVNLKAKLTFLRHVTFTTYHLNFRYTL